MVHTTYLWCLRMVYYCFTHINPNYKYTGVRVDGPANYESARKDGADFGILTPQKGVTSHFPVS